MSGFSGTFSFLRCFVTFSIYVKQCFADLSLFVERFLLEFSVPFGLFLLQIFEPSHLRHLLQTKESAGSSPTQIVQG